MDRVKDATDARNRKRVLAYRRIGVTACRFHTKVTVVSNR